MLFLPDLFAVFGSSDGHVTVVKLKHSNEPHDMQLEHVLRHHLLRTTPVLCLDYSLTLCKLNDGVLSDQMGQIAIVYEETVEIMSTNDWSVMPPNHIQLVESEGSFINATWAKNGGILTVATVSGYVYGEVTRVPALVSSCDSLVACMSSLSAVTVLDCLLPPDLPPGSPPVTVLTASLPQEPAQIRIGLGSTLCAFINSMAWFLKGPLINELPANETGKMEVVYNREYMTVINDVMLTTDYVAVTLGNRVLLHSFEDDGFEQWFPVNQSQSITQTRLSSEFLVYSTEKGIHVFSLVFRQMVSEVQLPSPVINFFPNPQHSRFVVIDGDDQGYFVNPITSSVKDIPDFPSGSTALLTFPIPLFSL
ncbi:hypothetical protein GEMRC1_007681 [Eukaryota sp. GEM-RC1]